MSMTPTTRRTSLFRRKPSARWKKHRKLCRRFPHRSAESCESSVRRSQRRSSLPPVPLTKTTEHIIEVFIYPPRDPYISLPSCLNVSRCASRNPLFFYTRSGFILLTHTSSSFLSVRPINFTLVFSIYAYILDEYCIYREVSAPHFSCPPQFL